MKKLLTLVLALALCTSLAATALATTVEIAPISAPLNDELILVSGPTDEEGLPTPEFRTDLPAGIQDIMPLGTETLAYTKQIVLNGEVLSAIHLPAANGVPMRLLVEADGGSAEWYPAESMSSFFFGNTTVSITYVTGIVRIDGTPFAAPGTELIQGVTYFSVGLINALPGFTAVEEDGVITITTPNANPLVGLAKDIIARTEMAASMSHTLDQLVTFYGFEAENYEEVVAYLPMIVRADTVIIAKAAPGKLDAVKADLQARLDATIASFEFYLPDPYAMAQEGKIVTNGDWAMLIISPDTDLATQLFNAAIGG